MRKYGRIGGTSWRRGPAALLMGAIVASALLLHPVDASAQAGPTADNQIQLSDIADRIVAVVGDSAILKTQLDERALALQLQGFPIPDDPEALLEFELQLLDRMIDESLVLQEALRDSTLSVDDDRVTQIVDADLEDRARSMGGQTALEQALVAQGMTLASFREELAADARRTQLTQQYVSKARRSVRVDPVNVDSVRAFFEANREQIGKRPATITFLQAVIEPGPSDSADAATKAEADEIHTRIIAGEDFAELAERYSDDPGSAANGGDLGWFRRNGQMVKEFEDVAYTLGSGQVSRPFKTQFGYHIMKVERIRGPERRARHILIRFDPEASQVDKTRALADSLRMRTEAGESLKQLHSRYGIAGFPDSLSIPLTDLNSLPAGYAPALRSAVAGEVLGPIDLSGRDMPSFAVLRVLQIRDEGDYTLEDLDAQIRDQLQDQNILQAVLSGLRERRYVDIRLDESDRN